MGEVALRRIQAGVERSALTLAAPVPTATGTGSNFGAGVYTVGYTYVNSGGQTLISTTATVTLTAGQNISFASLTPLPAAATGVNYYVSAVGGTTLTFAATSSGGVTVITTTPLAGASPPPTNLVGFWRGVAVAANRRLYGTVEVQRGQAKRFAVEDRGMFVDKYRSNPKLVEATFKLDSDATFEDLPYMLDTVLSSYIAPINGGAANPVSSQAGAVQTWSFTPDITTDTITTRTLEVGAEDVQWRGQFATTDTADFTMSLDDALKVSYNGFTADWQPNGVNAWTGFTAAIPDHAVESVMGYQCKLFVGTGATAGQVADLLTGRFVSASWGYHNQNKRKYFGDNNGAVFTKLGRGRRQVHCQVVFEGYDTVQYNQWTNNTPMAVRVAAIGTALPGTSPVVYKEQDYDFYGNWDTFQIGSRETNVTWQLDLQAIYSISQGTEAKVTIVNGLTPSQAGINYT